MNDRKNAIIIAAIIPTDVRENIPIASPIGPFVNAFSNAPCISEWPKLVIGTSAPPPNISIK